MTTRSVYPSGLARAASSVPIRPLAPPRLSTTTGWPQPSESFCATVREMMSVPPPGGNGTMRRTGRLGYACAAVSEAALSSAIESTPASTASAFMARNAIVLRDEMKQMRGARRGCDVMNHVIARRQVHDANVAQLLEQHLLLLGARDRAFRRIEPEHRRLDLRQERGGIRVVHELRIGELDIGAA